MIIYLSGIVVSFLFGLYYNRHSTLHKMSVYTSLASWLVVILFLLNKLEEWYKK